MILTEFTWRDVHRALVLAFSQRPDVRDRDRLVWVFGTEVAEVVRQKIEAESSDVRFWKVSDPPQELKVEGARMYGIRCTVIERSDPRRIELCEVIGRVEVLRG